MKEALASEQTGEPHALACGFSARFLMLRVASERCNHNPKRQRGIALLTVRAEICVLAHHAELVDELDSMI